MKRDVGSARSSYGPHEAVCDRGRSALANGTCQVMLSLGVARSQSRPERAR